MKRVLVLVGERNSANGICAFSIMNEFIRRGYEVKCITNQEFKKEKNLNNSGITIYPIKPRLTYRMMNWNNNRNEKINKIINRISFIINKLKLIISVFTWPLISPMYTWRFYKKAKEIYQNDRYDIIIPIYTQIDTIIASYFIKKRYKDVYFVPYFLDSLSGGYGPKHFSENWIVKRGLFWEEMLLPLADKIIFMNSSKPHHEKYSIKKEYFKRVRFLDIPLLAQPKIIQSTSLLNEDKINLVYVGSIPVHIRNPKYILDIFECLNEQQCSFTIIGTNTCPDLIKEVQRKCGEERLRVLDKVSHLEAISILNKADILVNIGNNIPTMVPSKIFEYMSLGKPIISTYPIENEPSLLYLKKYPLYLAIKEDYGKFDENLKKVKKFIIEKNDKKVDFKKIEKSLYKNTPKAFVDEIERDFLVFNTRRI